MAIESELNDVYLIQPLSSHTPLSPGTPFTPISLESGPPSAYRANYSCRGRVTHGFSVFEGLGKALASNKTRLPFNLEAERMCETPGVKFLYTCEKLKSIRAGPWAESNKVH